VDEGGEGGGGEGGDKEGGEVGGARVVVCGCEELIGSLGLGLLLPRRKLTPQEGS